jgi:hypothetical protein
MEVVTIEKETFEKMLFETNEAISMTEDFLSRFKPGNSGWLDHHQVCAMLCISKRTLQNYKELGLLLCTSIDRKNYFNLCDVERLLKKLSKSSYGTNNKRP